MNVPQILLKMSKETFEEMGGQEKSDAESSCASSPRVTILSVMAGEGQLPEYQAIRAQRFH